MAFTSRKQKRAQIIALVLLNCRREQRSTNTLVYMTMKVPLKIWLKGSVTRTTTYKKHVMINLHMLIEEQIESVSYDSK